MKFTSILTLCLLCTVISIWLLEIRVRRIKRHRLTLQEDNYIKLAALIVAALPVVVFIGQEIYNYFRG